MELFKVLTKKDVESFMAIFPELILDIMLENEEFSRDELGLTQNWLSHLILNNVPSGEIAAGLATALSFRHIAKNASKEDIKLSYILGWCVEIFSTSFFILDDLVDSSNTRKGLPCWHRRDDRGYNAVEDAALLENCVFFLLRKHFSHKECYPKLVELFQDAAFKTTLGESRDLRSTLQKSGNTAMMTMENYIPIAKYKAIYAPTTMHVVLALHLAGIQKKEVFRVAEKISREIDFQYQVRDDFMDCFGPEEELGTDIQEGKCTWNICTALELANEAQKKELMELYGMEGKSERVKEIYEELDLPKVFETYEKAKFNEIMEMTEDAPEELPFELFMDMAWVSFPTLYEKAMRDSPEADEIKNKKLTLEDLKSFTREISNFMHVFPDLLEFIFQDEELADLADLHSWIAFVFQYNVPNGKRTRGLTTALTCRELRFNFSSDAKEEMKKAYILGWCVEMLQAAALIVDDIMDHSEYRRGRPCWYKMEGLGNEAFNDASILENVIYYILRKNFGEEDYYRDILEIFQDTVFKTGLGQSLDVQTGLYCQMENFTMDRYSAIVKYKTSYYTFHLPIALGLSLAGMKDPEVLEETKDLLLEIGQFFQVQDDYLDCFGKPEVTGKVGTDIADGKCSWLVIKALEKSTPEQKLMLKENYGKGVGDQDKIQRVTELFIELEIPEEFRAYEARTYELISKQIDDLPDEAGERKLLLRKVLKTTYKRDA